MQNHIQSILARVTAYWTAPACERRNPGRKPDFWLAPLLIAAGLALVSSPMTSLAQNYPDRPIRLIVPFPPGGGADFIARLLSDAMGPQLGQPVIVENRPGASGNIGMGFGARAPADGYTLTLIAQGATVNPYLFQKLPYDPNKDFAPISLIARYYSVLVVNKASTINSVRDLIAAARAQPDTVKAGTAGVGGSADLATRQLMGATRTSLIIVPYKGTGPAVTDLLGGHITMLFDVISSAKSMIEAGNVKPIGITAPNRLASLPNVPAIAEEIPGFSIDGWFGVVAPGGTPPAIVEKLHAAVSSIARTPSHMDRLTSAGYEVVISTPAAFARTIQSDLQSYGKLIRDAGIKLQ